jgi:hypothetical protein
MRELILLSILALAPVTSGAQELICKGNIFSTQGEGMVARKHRFEVSDVTGGDVTAVLENCSKIAAERQARAARKNPGGSFTRQSEVELQCSKGAEQFTVRRTIQTGR